MKALITLLIVALAVIAGLGYRQARTPFQGYAGRKIVEIRPGMHVKDIAALLQREGVVRHALVFEAGLWARRGARRLRSGEYEFSRPLSPFEVIDKLVRGEVYLRPVTVPEGLTIPEVAMIVSGQGFGTAEEFERAAASPALIADLDPRATDLEGYLFPETYKLAKGTEPARIVRSMVEQFKREFGAERRRRAGNASVRDVMTLASMVEKETARPEERPLVAAVYRNRLNRHMPLQCDPTVIYALTRAGRYDGRLHKRDLEFDSPYNTYKYPGLPPGPIASPGLASIEAVLHPTPVSYLYFVSRNDGTHVFANTLEEHNRNVARFHMGPVSVQRPVAGASHRGGAGMMLPKIRR